MSKIRSAIEIISNAIECEIENSEDANDPIYAEELKIALKEIRKTIDNCLDKGITND